MLQLGPRTIHSVATLAAAFLWLLTQAYDLFASPSHTLKWPLTSRFWMLASLTAVSGIVALFLLNINLTAPHRLYRDHSRGLYIDRTEDEKKSIPLDGINSTGFAPYHLINAAVNLPSGANIALRERRSDFFLFSKYWCGAPSIGYERTWKRNAGSARPDLATAMAVSGAAAPSHMGLGSIPSLSALLAFLNVRLGYWIRRPGWELRWVRWLGWDGIEPDLTALRADLISRFSQAHSIMCRVKYPKPDSKPETGLILYLKLSDTGDEIELIKRYRAVNPDFPHQSTLDQFFDEEQFEAYRQLGVHVAEGLFSPAVIGAGASSPTIEELFKRLAKNLLLPESQAAISRQS
jgi:hypothetical protein